MLFVKNKQSCYVTEMEKENLTEYEKATQRAWKDIVKKVMEMKDSGIPQMEISRRLGVSRSLVTRWLKEKASLLNPPFSEMLKYIDVLGLNIHDYLPNTPTISRMGKYSPKDIVKGESLPFVPVLGSTGAGHDIELFNAEPETFIQVLPQYMLPGLAAFRVDGDSMEPTIKCGSYVGVVPFSGDVAEGGIYLVRIPPFGRLIKRLKLGDKGNIVLVSDNKMYSEKTIEYEGYDDIILGRVAWVWQLF